MITIARNFTQINKLIPNIFQSVLPSFTFSSSQKPPKKPFSSPEPQSFIKPNMVKRDGVFIDQQRIKAKIKQIKARSQVAEDQKKKKQQKQFMKNYTINKDPSKVKKFRKDTNTQNLMQFQDVSLDLKPTTIQVTSFNRQSIQIDQFSYPPSVVLTTNQPFIWQIKQVKQTTPQHYKLIEMISPPPSYIIIGTSKPDQIPKNVRKYVESFGVDCDFIGVFQAISNFNTFAADDVRVMAFINTSKQ